MDPTAAGGSTGGDHERLHPVTSSENIKADDGGGEAAEMMTEPETKKEEEEKESDVHIPPPHTKPPDGWWGLCTSIGTPSSPPPSMKRARF